MTTTDRGHLRSGLAIAAAIAALQLLLQLLHTFNGNYGIFRDELYYLDCARHLGLDEPHRIPPSGDRARSQKDIRASLERCSLFVRSRP